MLYFDIGRKISIKTREQAWGSKTLERISKELQDELPGLKGFSSTNLQRMVSFYDRWNNYLQIHPTVSGKFQINNGTLLPTKLQTF